MFLKYLLAKLRSESGQADTGSAVAAEPGAKDTSSQSDQDKKLEGLIADIDLSDIPEDQLPSFKQKLAAKVKEYDTGVKAKFEVVANDRRELESQKQQVQNLLQLREEISGNPALEKEITRVINQARAGNLTSSQPSSIDRQVKTIDKLLDTANDAETRETLRQLKTIIEESVPGEDAINKYVEKALAPFKDELTNLQKATQSSQAERVEASLSKLESELGKDLVDKYRDQVRGTALKLNSSHKDIKRLLYHYADDTELETAILDRAKRKKDAEEKRKLEGSAAGTHGISTPIELKKDKVGRTDIADLVKKILS